ncbi:MAG: hypothetical protein ACRD2C_25590 [Acidimicrobiales bacterium]
MAASAAVALGAPGAGAQDSGDTDPPERVLLLSLPGLTWTDVRDYDLPAIEGWMEEAALADLAPRGVSAIASPGAAYLTISAGARATSERLVDGQQLALGDQAAGSPAGEIFERRTGTQPDGEYVALAWPALVGENADQPYDAELGLLTDTLAEAGLTTAAIGNADGADSVGPSFERQVGLAAIDGEGVVPAGELGTDLLVDDVGAPFGRRLNHEQVVEKFGDAWADAEANGGGLVVVEASDLARTMRYRDRVDASRYAELWSEALAATDVLVADLLARVDPERDAVVLAAPYNQPGDRDLTVAGLQEPGEAPGYMRSASTQRSGFMTLVDLAPTVLRLLDVDRPVEMEGRPGEAVASGDSLDRRVDRLVSLNAASRFRERLLFPTTLALVVALAVVCAVAAVVIVRGGSEQNRRLVRVAALTDLAVLPMSYVARAFPLEDLGAGFYWAFIVLGALVVALAATGFAARLGRPGLALVVVLVLMIGVLAFDVMTGSNLSLSAAFGYSPTGNSRLYGISNYSFGQIAAASCLLAAMLASWRSRVAAIVLLLAVLVVVGVPIWGSDVGGVLAFTPTVLLFALLVWQGRVRLRHVVIGLSATVVAVTVFGLLDLARPPEQRAHLGRLFERVSDEGVGPLWSIVERKAVANLGVSTTSFWIAAIPVAVAFIVFLARYPSHPLAATRERIPLLRAGLLAAASAALLGSLANDSGMIVGGVALLVVAASLAHLALEPAPTPASPPPRVTGANAHAHEAPAVEVAAP